MLKNDQSFSMNMPAIMAGNAAIRAAEPAASARRLRIAYVLHDYNRHFGHSRYVAELAMRFRDEHEVHVFANTFTDADERDLIYHYVPANRMNVMTTLLSFIVPATWAVGGSYDIVHAQGACGLRQNVVTAHMCQAAWLESMTRNMGQPSWRKWLFHSVADWFERRTFSRGGTRRVIAVSHRIGEDLLRYYGCTNEVRVIHHGVDVEAFHPGNRERWLTTTRAEIGVSDEATLALYVGDYQKGLTPTLGAIAQVPGLHLVGVSRSPTEPYRQLIRSLDIVDRVHLMPATANVERYYAAADMFVFPTFYDPFGLVATEAMASGLPVICSRAAGASEVIQNGVDGFVVENPWDVDCLTQPLRLLALDPALRRRVGMAARQSVEGRTWDEVARQTMAVYREIA